MAFTPAQPKRPKKPHIRLHFYGPASWTTAKQSWYAEIWLRGLASCRKGDRADRVTGDYSKSAACLSAAGVMASYPLVAV